MSVLVIVLHVVVSIALILIVLLQTGKGADIGAAFGGGGGNTLFGGGGASSFLSKLTTIVAIVFMLTSLTLAYMSGYRSSSSIMSDVAAPVPPSASEAPALPAQSPFEPEATAPQATEPQAKQAEAPEPVSGPAGQF